MKWNFFIFTFHNVSIKTCCWVFYRLRDYTFTFHNVSIKTNIRNCVLRCCWNLHSTMFLLKHLHLHVLRFHAVHLHSTMFLLKLQASDASRIADMNLHSTMFLLKPIHRWIASNFQDHLHSTMFLLKPKNACWQRQLTAKFTFHNVSIKTAAVKK